MKMKALQRASERERAAFKCCPHVNTRLAKNRWRRDTAAWYAVQNSEFV